MEEIWKSAKGLEGYYECSNLGNVRSVERSKNISHGKKGLVKPKVLSNYKNKLGYVKLSISATENYPRRTINAHRIIAETWIENPKNKPHVNHINGIKHDNRVENLEWATREENMQHAHLHGLMKMPKGTSHFMFNIKSELHPRAKKVINVKTKDIYGCVKDCAKSIGMNVGTLTGKLNDKRINETDIMYFDDYINNNGWIKIESEADLPKDDNGFYWAATGDHVYTYIYDSTELESDYKLSPQSFTDYKPVIKPMPPIY